MPDYAKRPDYINEETRLDFTYKNNLRFLRYYQVDAIKSIQTAVKNGKDRFQMATGTENYDLRGSYQTVFKDRECAQSAILGR